MMKKLGIDLPNDEIYMLNDNTLDKIKNGLVYNMAGGNEENQTSVSDGELVRITRLYDKITFKTTEPDKSKDMNKRVFCKSRLAGAFFEHVSSSRLKRLLFILFLENVGVQYREISNYVTGCCITVLREEECSRTNFDTDTYREVTSELRSGNQVPGLLASR